MEQNHPDSKLSSSAVSPGQTLKKGDIPDVVQVFHVLQTEGDLEPPAYRVVEPVIEPAPQSGLGNLFFNRRCQLGLVVFFLVAFITVIISVSLTSSSSTASIPQMPSSAPSSTPSVAPTTELLQELIETVTQLTPNSDATVFENTGTPQYRAALWITGKDTYWMDSNLSVVHPKVLQRYALASFYYSTKGPNWSLCRSVRWNDCQRKVKWLSPVDECDWYYVTCDGDTFITGVNFGKFL